MVENGSTNEKNYYQIYKDTELKTEKIKVGVKKDDTRKITDFFLNQE